VPLLASVGELAAFTGRDIADDDPSAMLALETATALCQAETRQQLVYVEDDTVTLIGGASRLLLPERPVTAVSVVTGSWNDQPAQPLPVHWWRHLGNGVLVFGPNTYAGWDAQARFPWTVTVTYSHGFRVVPADLRAAALALAARSLNQSDPDAALVAQETVGSYSVTYSRSSQEPAVDVARVLGRYRRQSWSAAQ